MPGPSVWMTGLPGMLRGDDRSVGRRASSRHATGEGDGMGPDEMVIG